MNSSRSRFGTMALCSLLAGLLPDGPRRGQVRALLGAPGAAAAGEPPQAMACPTYWPPSQSRDWDAYTSAVPAASIAILNREVTTSYTDAFVRELQSKGLMVIGYVNTTYMAADVAVVRERVERYYAEYPTLDGIFVDEVDRSWTAGSEAYYTQIHDQVKGMNGKRLVVLNFGTQHDEPFMNICDISVNMEVTWSAYDAWSGLSGSAWEWNYPSNRFWHLIHQCPSDHLAEAVAKSKRNNTGYVFVTDHGPDPWGGLPSYWERERDEVQPTSRWRWRNDAVNLHGRFQFQNDWDYKRVFIDTDRVGVTGFHVAGIGAEFLLENDGLYAYTGTGSDWRWSLVRVVAAAVETNPNAIAWDVPRSDLGGTMATSLVFEVERWGGLRKTGRPYAHVDGASDGGIVDYGEENDASRFYFHADFAGGWTWSQVFIDTDAAAGTGYQIGGAGCEWLIENDDLYRYTGDGSSWSWSPRLVEPDGSAAAHHTVDGTVHDWWVWRATLGEQRFDRETNRLVLRGHSGPTLYQTPLYDFEASP